MISKDQHEFFFKHSVVTNLMESLNDWTSNLENKSTVKILYIDFAKAFDSVSIPKLLQKLINFGIEGLLISCIKSFLTDRHQRVKVGKEFSGELSLVSGVPQGSVLGPFLFLLFINDLPMIFDKQVQSKLFADDLKSYNQDDYRLNSHSTQTSLDLLNDWAKTWQLKMAIPKCGSLLLKGCASFLDSENLYIDNMLLPAFESVNDLGVIIDSDLSFTAHITGVISKSKQRIYLLLKAFQSRNIALMVFAYKT